MCKITMHHRWSNNGECHHATENVTEHFFRSHALAQKLLPRGAGSVFSFDIQGTREQGKAFIEALQVFSHLANVGDCRSLVIHPASTTHFRVDDETLKASGIGPGTVRLSIGLEDPDDLIDDLKRALKAAEKAALQSGGVA